MDLLLLGFVWFGCGLCSLGVRACHLVSGGVCFCRFHFFLHLASTISEYHEYLYLNFESSPRRLRCWLIDGFNCSNGPLIPAVYL